METSMCQIFKNMFVYFETWRIGIREKYGSDGQSGVEANHTQILKLTP